MEEVSEAAIYKGFYWNNPLSEVLALKPICQVEGRQLEALKTSLDLHLQRLDGSGRIPGIPDRTLLLPSFGIRIVYGGSMGPEIGLHSLDGEVRRGFFYSDEFLTLLRRIERSCKPWWKLW